MTKTSGVAQSQLFGEDKPKPAEVRARAVRSRPRRPAKPIAAVAPPPPQLPVKKEVPPTVEIILGTKKFETKFGQ